jgi:hypothetical protein
MNTPSKKGSWNTMCRATLLVTTALLLATVFAACKGKQPAPEAPAPAPAAAPGSAQTPAAPAPAPAPGAAVPAPTAAAPAAPGAPAPAAPAAPVTAAGPAANLGKLLPVDEAKRAPGLADFRNKLEAAVKKKDKAAVLSMLAPNVRTTGNQQGVDAFAKAWNLDDPNSRFWTDMATILRQGGSFGLQGGNTTFTAPHVFGRLPQNLDPAQYGVISGERVNIRKTPDRQGETVTRLTYDVVKLAPNPNPKTETIDGETHPWVPIILPDGQTGYVYGRYIRQANGLHAAFERVNNEWKLTYFGEGQ